MPEIIALFSVLIPHLSAVMPDEDDPASNRFNLRQIEAKYCVSTDTIGNLENRSISNETTSQKVRRRTDEGLHPQDKPDHKTASTRLSVQL